MCLFPDSKTIWYQHQSTYVDVKKVPREAVYISFGYHLALGVKNHILVNGGVETLKRSEIIQFKDQIITTTKMKHIRINHISDKKYQFQEKPINLEFIRCLAVAAIEL